MTELTVTADDFAQALRSAGVGQVFLPGEPGYDAARTPWNLAVEQLPAAVVVPTTATEVANAVRVSAAAGLRVVAQSTGHGAGPLAGRTQGTVLLRLSDFTGVSVDASPAAHLRPRSTRSSPSSTRPSAATRPGYRPAWNAWTPPRSHCRTRPGLLSVTCWSARSQLPSSSAGVRRGFVGLNAILRFA